MNLSHIFFLSGSRSTSLVINKLLIKDWLRKLNSNSCSPRSFLPRYKQWKCTKIWTTKVFTCSTRARFSNFYAAPFYDDDFYKSVEFVSSFRSAEGRVAFEHVEQYMHACKAVLFNDEQTFARIMREKHPMESKNLGRRVENFREDSEKIKCLKSAKHKIIHRWPANSE